MKARPRTTAAKKRLLRLQEQRRLRKKSPHYNMTGRSDMKHR